MADVSKIKLPNGTTYDIKDAVARAKFPVAVIDGGTGKTSALEGFWNLENRGHTTNANDALSVGLYDTNTSTQNLPALAYSQNNGCGVLIVYVSYASTHNNSSNWIWQMWLNTTTSDLYIRKKINTNAWSTWTTQIDLIQTNKYFEGNNPSYGLDMHNSDIVNVNGIYTADYASEPSEGINFQYNATTYDSLWAKGGKLYFTPLRPLNQKTGPQGDLEFYTQGWYGNGTTDVAMRSLVAYTRANRLAFLPADQVIIEETTDGGQTWTSGDYTDANKKSLFATRGANIKIPLLNGEKSTNCGVRITITGMKYNVPDDTLETEKYNYWNAEYLKSSERYCNLREMWFWLSSNNDAIRCQVYRATGAKPNNWIECFNTDFGMTGWSGSDWIRFNGNWTFGGGTTQASNFWNWRIIFWSRMLDGKDTFNSNTQQSIAGINGYGDNVWTTPNGLMKEDHLYTWDANMVATFPSRVQAASFKGVGTELTALNGSNISSGTVPTARLPTASQSAAGIISAQDKIKLDGIDAGANKITTDSSISSGSTSTNVPTSAAVASFVESKGYILSTQKGVANGLAELDENGKVPSSQLPSYVDEVLEFSNRDNFPLTGKSGIIYIDTNTNLTYRWGGSDYIEISPSLALGTTSSTAFRGDYGNTAYSHATDSNRLTTAKTTGLYKIAATAQGHIASATAVTKADITALGVPASDTTYTFDGTYNASTNKAATVSTVTTAINALGAAATKGVTDNTTAKAPSSSDTNLITGRTLYYAIASTADINALF